MFCACTPDESGDYALIVNHTELFKTNFVLEQPLLPSVILAGTSPASARYYKAALVLSAQKVSPHCSTVKATIDGTAYELYDTEGHTVTKLFTLQPTVNRQMEAMELAFSSCGPDNGESGTFYIYQITFYQD